PPQVTADFDAMAYEPVVEFQVTELDSTTETTVPAPAVPQAPAIEAAPTGSTVEMTTSVGMESFDELFASADGTTPAIEFAGSRASNANRIVYVIDASGSLTPYLQIVLEEMFRSLRQLDDRQQFAIIFFQRDQALPVPPRGRLQKATGGAVDRAIDWINTGANVVPGDSSNPLAALEMAFDLHPQVIFLLSDSITGSGAYEVDRGQLLAQLEDMNPVIESSTGRRKVQVNCIQFLAEEEDRLGTLRTIAERHGGEGGYKVYDRAAMGLGE
ncbi:MAG TPA: hypothetical protein DEO57_07650, partial [Phycisphaerales bacterium]|nr:hypothetical protein [Phycisphaerales bacterium]